MNTYRSILTSGYFRRLHRHASRSDAPKGVSLASATASKSEIMRPSMREKSGIPSIFSSVSI